MNPDRDCFGRPTAWTPRAQKAERAITDPWPCVVCGAPADYRLVPIGGRAAEAIPATTGNPHWCEACARLAAEERSR